MTNSKRRLIGTAALSVLLATGSIIAHAQMDSSEIAASVEKSQLVVGKRYYISADALNVRSSNSTSASNVVGKLSRNDVVEVYNLLNSATPLVQIKIVKSSSVRSDAAAELYVSKDYLSEKEITYQSGSKYFVIQNVATERTRVYERCSTTPDCPHKLVLETEMVVGRPEVGTDSDPDAFKTWLGHAQVSEWVKFYQDGQGHYPHWYKAGQDIDDIPGSISGSLSNYFGARKWMVRGQDGNTTIYGAFGWYAAKVTPADDRNGMNYQWMHGTMGWGKDGPAAIEMTRGFLANLVSNPGSAGCTRLENRAIAFLRTLLPVGTDIYRVYAQESTREPQTKNKPLSRYTAVYNNPGSWDYILLTDGAQRSGGLAADARTVLSSGVSIRKDVNLLEKGTYEYDRYPDAIPLNYNAPAASGRSGDRYRINNGFAKNGNNFKGYFLVDEGRFVDYQHPKSVGTKVRVSGLPDFRNSVPEYLKATGSHYEPAVTYRRD